VAYVIKRYANRKLYDMGAKKYVTLDDVATLVESGLEVHIIDKQTGGDITNVVLSKAISEMISEDAGKEKTWRGAVLTEIIQKRSDAAVDFVKQRFAAGMRTVKDVEEQLQQGWKRVTGREGANGSGATEELKHILQRMIEESVQYLIAKMNLPTRSEIQALNARLDEIERELKTHRRSKTPARAK
jgi:polyhydroxyalkanoate synthesis repressor PhaR